MISFLNEDVQLRLRKLLSEMMKKWIKEDRIPDPARSDNKDPFDILEIRSGNYCVKVLFASGGEQTQSLAYDGSYTPIKSFDKFNLVFTH